MLYKRPSQTRNQEFFRAEEFLGIRALRQIFTYNTGKKGSAGKNFQFFRMETLKNCILNEKLCTYMTKNRAIFLKCGHLFPFSKKSRGDLHPSLPLVTRLHQYLSGTFQVYHHIYFKNNCRENLTLILYLNLKYLLLYKLVY